MKPGARPSRGNDDGDAVRTAQLWRLEAAPAELTSAARTWRGLAGTADALSQRVDHGGRMLLAAWRGAAADAYGTHHSRLVRAFAAVSTMAGSMADLVDHAAATLATAQEHLDDSWLRLRRSLPAGLAGDWWIPVTPTDPAQAAAVRAAVREAHDIRSHADARLRVLAADAAGLQARLGEARSLAADVDPDGTWAPPAEGGRPGLVLLDGDRVIVNGTAYGDAITVRMDPMSRQRIVTIDGVVRRFPADLDLVVRGGGGNDVITVEPGTPVRVTLLGGAGDDAIRGGDGEDRILGLWGTDTITGGAAADLISGGEGRDYLDGQAGADRIGGGPGTDTLLGGDGADRVTGGPELDYLDGGAGDDDLDGGPAHDVVFGGRGDDAVAGGGSDDTLYGGPGTDRLSGGEGTDTAYGQAGDTIRGVEQPVRVELTGVGGFIRVEGSPEFVARVGSDLDALRSSPRGEQMLAVLQHSHDANADRVLVIREIATATGYAQRVGSGAEIGYNARFDDFTFSPPVPPVVVLFHELAHVEDFFSDTVAEGTYGGQDNPGVANAEREATGLPIDDDQHPSTPDRIDPDHPFALTENGLREELGLDRRARY